MYDDVKNYLESEQRFRERKNKDRGMVNLLMRRYGQIGMAVESGAISKDTLIAFVQEYNSMDRYWRQILEKNERLRGTDYGDKQKVEEQKLASLGYGYPMGENVRII